MSSTTIILQPADIHIPGYRVLRPLGDGGMASVYLAVQESLDREVALKVMAPALVANSEFTERFVKEGRITAQLSHPNLVTVYDIGSHGTTYYIAAEYISGGTLKERISRGMTVAEVLDVVCDVARGLEYAHKKGVVHRDVKPGNILFKPDGTAVLADFGIAKAMDNSSSMTMAGSSIGTPDYMSPEQARAEPVDGRSDLYSMGAMLYEMLTGAPPYTGNDPFSIALAHVTQPVPELPPEHHWLQPLLDGLMAKSLDQRFSSGQEFLNALEKLLAASPEAIAALQGHAIRTQGASGMRLTSAHTALRTQAVGKPSWFWPAIVGGALLLAVLLGIVLLRGGKPEVDPAQMGVTNVSTSIDNSEIAALLLQADTFRDIGTNKDSPNYDPGRYINSPPGENAVELYQRVLALDPANAAANAGLDAIANYYLEFAGKYCEREIWGSCQTTAELGLKARSDHAELKALLEKAEAGKRGIQ